ncbi:quinol oxidase [Sulfolobales archaeon HS-7]|nr:quinol oxidase [Sulfolobales archaeon HS-7]
MVSIMDRTTVVALIFGLIIVGFVWGTGQWAYGNLYGPLFNDSKLPELRITYITSEQLNNGTMIIMNVTDIDGPDAYPASAPLMEIYNSTWHVYLNSSQISRYTVAIIQAPWNSVKKDFVNNYTGIAVILGTMAQFHLSLPYHLTKGEYKIILYTPAISLSREAVAEFSVS